MVWLPGGGFQESNAARVNVHGNRLATREVVVVSANYRAGVFGFLAHRRSTRRDTVGELRSAGPTRRAPLDTRQQE
jgi:carboxylesterase type B